MSEERQSVNAQRVPQLMMELADVAQRVIMARIEDIKEPDLGKEIARAFCSEFGGELVYIPKGHHIEKAARDQALLAYFNRSGRNVQATAKEFRICVQQVYRRVAMMEDEELHRIQPSLFQADQ